MYQKISVWNAEIKLETDEGAAAFRSNNVKEYRKFENSIRSQGIKMEYTIAYTSEENGVAERFNRIIIQMTRAMLLWAEFPQRFWGEVVSTTNYLRNLMPAKQDKKKSPNELWTRSRPDVSHLRKFECFCFVHISKEKRNKLDAVSFKGIFVGYHSSTQMRVFNAESGKINWHTSVIFREDTSGGRLLRSSGRNEKNIASIFDDDTDEEEEIDQNVQNIETSTSEQRIIELMGDELTNPTNKEENHENRENQVISANQKARNLRKFGNSSQPTRKSARVTKPYNPYEFDN